MSAPWLFLLASLWGAWFTWNTRAPIYVGPRRSFLSFFAGWLTSDLAPYQVAWQVVATAVFVWMGALEAWPGWLGLAVCVVSWTVLIRDYLRGSEAGPLVENALVAALGASYRDEIEAEAARRLRDGSDWRDVVFPFARGDRAVERIRDVEYARDGAKRLLLDVYRPRDRDGFGGAPSPVLLQVHGGGWVVGTKNEQAVPLMLRMARHGWTCISIDYRLSPRATFPDHIVDVKRAIAWIRENAASYGADPDWVVVTGGSAGGHLASLAALSANDPAFQPGFTDVDTTLRGCVSFYGVYDFTDEEKLYRNDGFRMLLQRYVMKTSREEAPELYRAASPACRIHAEAPPFLIIHGDRDTLVPVAEARRFADKLRRVSQSPVVYVEVPGTQHAFEILRSPRAAHVLNGVERFLLRLHGLARTGVAVESEPAQETLERAADPGANGVGELGVAGGEEVVGAVDDAEIGGRSDAIRKGAA